MLTFDASTGLTAPSASEIRQGVADKFIAAFKKDGLPELNTAPETPAGQLIDSITAMIEDKNAEILYLANQFNPLTADGIWQAALGKIYFLTPNVEQHSITTCTCTGLEGTIIPAGAQITSANNGTVWENIDEVEIPSSGSVSALFRCSDSGAVQAAKNTLVKIQTIVPGWDEVTNPGDHVDFIGNNAESRLAFEDRRYKSVAINATGSVNALYSAIASVKDVSDVCIIENATSASITEHGVTVPAHSVWISVYGGSNANVAKAIYMKKNAGCGTAGGTTVTYTDRNTNASYSFQICRPSNSTLRFKVQVKKDDRLVSGYKDTVTQALKDDFYGKGENPRCGCAQTILASRFYPVAMNVLPLNVLSVSLSKGYNTTSWGSSATYSANEEPYFNAAQIVFDEVE